MRVLYNSYPYWRYTPSQNGERQGLFSGHPLPLMVTHTNVYNKAKEKNEECKFIIEELTEADIPGPSLDDDLPVFEKLHKILEDSKIDPDDIHMIMPSINFDQQYLSWCRTSKQKEIIKHRHTYPFYFLDVQKKYEYVNNFNDNRICHMMSLNGAVKPKRVKFVNFCKENRLMDNYISLVGNYNTTGEQVEPVLLDADINKLNTDDKEVPIDMMYQSWLNVVNETHEDNTIFFTEKTWKPILNLQLFLFYGVGHPVDYYDALESFGFKLYDEIFDYGNDPEKEILKFCSTPLQFIQSEIVEQVKEKMLYNQQLALNTDWREKHLKTIYKEIYGKEKVLDNIWV
tara:strand:- start:2104 stop:3132 length:1029 start_codon:yes stop_codon:yes gene_type:complete